MSDFVPTQEQRAQVEFLRKQEQPWAKKVANKLAVLYRDEDVARRRADRLDHQLERAGIVIDSYNAELEHLRSTIKAAQASLLLDGVDAKDVALALHKAMEVQPRNLDGTVKE